MCFHPSVGVDWCHFPIWFPKRVESFKPLPKYLPLPVCGPPSWVKPELLTWFEGLFKLFHRFYFHQLKMSIFFIEIPQCTAAQVSLISRNKSSFLSFWLKRNPSSPDPQLATQTVRGPHVGHRHLQQHLRVFFGRSGHVTEEAAASSSSGRRRGAERSGDGRGKTRSSSPGPDQPNRAPWTVMAGAKTSCSPPAC